MRIVAGNAQDIGARDNQEDAFGFSNLEPEAQKRLGGVCMVLCDGMGGLARGGEASRAAVAAALAEFDRRHSSDMPAQTLRWMLEAAQHAVQDVSREAGTTFVACIIADRRLYWVSVGDSRLYLCRAFAKPRQLTEDDTVGATRRPGDERVVDQNANLEALTAYVGAPETPDAQITADGLPLRSGDSIVASSDGLHRGLDINELDRFASAGRPMASAQRMLQAVLAQRNATQDNVTVAILAMKPAVPYGPLFQGWLGATAVIGGLIALLVLLFAAMTYLSVTQRPSDARLRRSMDDAGQRAETSHTPRAPDVPIPPVPPHAAPGKKVQSGSHDGDSAVAKKRAPSRKQGPPL